MPTISTATTKERFCGINKLAAILPNSALFRIYEIQRRNSPALKRLENFKRLVPGLNAAELTPVDKADRWFNHHIVLPDLKDCNMTFLFNCANGHVNSVNLDWSKMLCIAGEFRLLRCCVLFNKRSSKIDLHLVGDVCDVFSEPEVVMSAWKMVLSSIVVICDRFLKTINPATMDICICTTTWNSQKLTHKTRVRLVDAVRAAALGRMDALINHKNTVHVG